MPFGTGTDGAVIARFVHQTGKTYAIAAQPAGKDRFVAVQRPVEGGLLPRIHALAVSRGAVVEIA